MARLKLSEFKAKSLLTDAYKGVSINHGSADNDIDCLLDDELYVVKVDQGVKKRGKQGLIRLNVKKDKIISSVSELAAQGFDKFIVEAMVPHSTDEEHYLCLERRRDGIQLSYSISGGVEIESATDTLKTSIYPDNCTPLPTKYLDNMVRVMNEQHMCLLELNPFLLRDDELILLDAAVLVDSAGEYFSQGWTIEDTVDSRRLDHVEAAVADLNENSTASFSLRLINPDGSLWLLLSGGGASISIADEAQNQGMGNEIANYGEYSGGPTTEETYLYTKQLLKALLKSKATKKALVIAGGVANFTDVQQTFKGVIQALDEVSEPFKRDKIKVFVRRGGPNEVSGLAEMTLFLDKLGLKGSVSGSEVVLTSAISQAMRYVR